MNPLLSQSQFCSWRWRCPWPQYWKRWITFYLLAVVTWHGVAKAADCCLVGMVIGWVQGLSPHVLVHAVPWIAALHLTLQTRYGVSSEERGERQVCWQCPLPLLLSLGGEAGWNNPVCCGSKSRASCWGFKSSHLRQDSWRSEQLWKSHGKQSPRLSEIQRKIYSWEQMANLFFRENPLPDPTRQHSSNTWWMPPARCECLQLLPVWIDYCSINK